MAAPPLRKYVFIVKFAPHITEINMHSKFRDIEVISDERLLARKFIYKLVVRSLYSEQKVLAYMKSRPGVLLVEKNTVMKIVK